MYKVEIVFVFDEFDQNLRIKYFLVDRHSLLLTLLSCQHHKSQYFYINQKLIDFNQSYQINLIQLDFNFIYIRPELRINIINSNNLMSGINAINSILDHIVKGGKALLKDKIIEREKVPTYLKNRIECINMESVIHEGNQHQPAKKFGYFSIPKDSQPENTKKDGGGPNRLKIEKRKIVNPKKASPQKNKYTQRSFSYTEFKEGRLKSAGFNSIRLQQKQKQKENCFTKLPEDQKNRKVVERVKLRESMEDDRLRAEKQKQNLKQYKQKLANEIFEKQRSERKSVKEKQLNQHTKKGEDHRFYFNDQGQAILLKHSKTNLVQNYLLSARQKVFKFDDQEENIIQQAHINSKRPYLSKKHFQSAKNVNDYSAPMENQRIRSAKGEAFASAVLKTVNLSKISMNQSLRQLQVEEFMKRNDLFNNNHTRQTTSIPYLEAKPGTVYTQLSTNQVVRDDNNQKLHESRRSSNDNSRTYSRKKSHFEPFGINQSNPTNKTQRNYDRFERNNQFDAQKMQARSVKTAEHYSRRGSLSERRPQSSINKGKITSVNQQLVIALIQ